MLIILNKSHTVNGYESMLKIAEHASGKGKKAAVLHIQDACLALTLEDYCEKLAKAKIIPYVLEADCLARGLLHKLGRSVQVINYEKWVSLVMREHKNIISWTS